MTVDLVRRSAVRLALSDHRTAQFAAARTALTCVQLAVVMFNPDSLLFGSPYGPRAGCVGDGAAMLWCLTPGDAAGQGLARGIAIAVLLAAASGFRPRWTCVPHWYVALSIGTDAGPTNGGEFVAEAVTLLLLAPCLADGRTWQWARPAAPPSPRLRGTAAAAMLTLRWQLALIYAEAAIAKALYPSWRDGLALRAVVLDPLYGVPGPARSWAGALTGSTAIGTAAGYAVVLAELAVVCCLLGPRRLRRPGLLLACLLHLGIAVFMGLITFSLTMIAATALAACGELDGLGERAPASRTPISTE